MVKATQMSNYLDLLKIRQNAKRGEVRIIGYLSLISLFSTLGFGLISGLSGREVYLVAGLNIVFGVVYLMAWVRLEIINAAIELVNHIQA